MFRKAAKKEAAASSPAEVTAPAPAQPNPPPAATAAVVKTSPSKPARTTATLKLSSTPPGAEILLDGKPTEKQTPSSVAITRGEHAIAIRMRGFQDASARFKVNGGEEFEFSPELVPLVGAVPNIGIPKVSVPDLSRLAELQNNPGLSAQQRAEFKLWEKWGAMQKAGELSIMVTSRPPGATILIDGKDTGKKTPEVIRSEPGRYTVRVELDGYTPYEKAVTVGPNRGPATVNARLTPKAPQTP
jgi:hypothetical protein